ncbi:MAG: tyrosine-type recombinase/integrase [Ruminococcus sp.]
MDLDCNILFSDLAKMWLERAKVGVSYSYVKSLSSCIKRINHYIGLYPLSEIKPMMIDDMMFSLAAENPTTHKPSAKKTLSQTANITYNIFEFAIDRELITLNPARNAKKRIPQKAPKKVVTAISMEQYDLVLNVENRLKTGAMIMMFAGLRRGELIALNWDDIHIDDIYSRKGISVTKRVQTVDTNDFEIVSGTKNGKTRFVPLPYTIIDYLKKEKLNAQSYLVCPQDNGDLQTPSTWSRYWKTYQADINYYAYCQKFKKLHPNEEPKSKFNPKGIPQVVEKFNAHQLRHMYATLLFLSGIDPLTASKLMGHSGVQITLDIYTHLEEQYRHIDVSKLDKFLKYDIDKIKHDI